MSGGASAAMGGRGPRVDERSRASAPEGLEALSQEAQAALRAAGFEQVIGAFMATQARVGAVEEEVRRLRNELENRDSDHELRLRGVESAIGALATAVESQGKKIDEAIDRLEQNVNAVLLAIANTAVATATTAAAAAQRGSRPDAGELLAAHTHTPLTPAVIPQPPDDLERAPAFVKSWLAILTPEDQRRVRILIGSLIFAALLIVATWIGAIPGVKP